MPVKSYDEFFLRSLQDPNEAAEYLTACYEDSMPVFLQGLRMLVEAHGGVSEVAKRTNLNSESLNQMPSEQGDPELSSLSVILEQIGFNVSFSSSSKQDVA